jgi:hypothetical protein
MQIVVPVLILRNDPPAGTILFAEQGFQPFGCLMARLVVVQAQGNRPQLRILAEHPEHRLTAHSAERHIAVAPPALRMQGD